MTTAHASSSMGAAALRTPEVPQKYLRARTVIACDDPEFSDEYEEALARYTALGVFDNVALTSTEEVDDGDDTTPEEMVVRAHAPPDHTLAQWAHLCHAPPLSTPPVTAPFAA